MFFKFFLVGILLAYLLLIGGMFLRRVFGRRATRHSAPLSSREHLPEGDVLIELRDVRISFDHPVLKGVSLKIHRGETVGVLGKSGTGKSVLLKLISGFLKPDDGEILFGRKSIVDMDENQLLEFRKKVSYVFQGGAFFDFLDVAENIAYPLRERGITDEEYIAERVQNLLEEVELVGMGDQRYDELSTGSRKQVAIARAIANEPEIILYDEPTTGVDPIIGKSLSELIRKLDKKEHFTAVVVTHDLRCIEIVADRIILLKDGYIRFAGTKEEFHSSEDAFVKAFIAGRHYDERPEEQLTAYDRTGSGGTPLPTRPG